jgi:hypothetical protein
MMSVTESNRMRWEGRVTYIREMFNAHCILVGKTWWKRLYGRPGVCENNFKINLKQTRGWDWIYLAWKAPLTNSFQHDFSVLNANICSPYIIICLELIT